MIRGLAEKLGLTVTLPAAGEELRSPKTQMALALGATKRPEQVYGGTVPQAVVDRRRVKNRTARKSRRVNRRSR